eukprot:s190_g2.t2
MNTSSISSSKSRALQESVAWREADARGEGVPERIILLRLHRGVAQQRGRGLRSLAEDLGDITNLDALADVDQLILGLILHPLQERREALWTLRNEDSERKQGELGGCAKIELRHFAAFAAQLQREGHLPWLRIVGGLEELIISVRDLALHHEGPHKLDHGHDTSLKSDVDRGLSILVPARRVLGL